MPTPGNDSLMSVLAHTRAAAAHYARRLHATGAGPEELRVRVEALVAEALAAEHGGEAWDDADAVRALAEQVVRWGLAAYEGSAGSW